MSRPLGLVLALAIVSGLVLWLALGPGAAKVEGEPAGREPVTPAEAKVATADPADSAPISPAGSNRTARLAEDVFHERMTARHGGQGLDQLRTALQALVLEVNVGLMKFGQPRIAAGEAPVDDGRVYPADAVIYRGPDTEGVRRIVVLAETELPAIQAKHREARWLAQEIERRGDSR